LFNILLTEARSWLDTPWRHNHRVKGEGVDCVNFLSACAESLGIEIVLPSFYESTPLEDKLKPYLDKYLTLLPTKELCIGNIVAFNYRGITHHVAIATSPNTIVHACRQKKKVVEEKLTRQQIGRISGVYLLKYAENPVRSTAGSVNAGSTSTVEAKK
jgi:cell wall-associated NlpC family hydrolase